MKCLFWLGQNIKTKNKKQITSCLTFVLAFLIFFLSNQNFAWSQAQPRVGRKSSTNGTTSKEAAAEYFTPDAKKAASDGGAAEAHYLALHLGKLVSGEAWKWGSNDKQTDSGSTSFGVTYRVQEYYNSMDLNVRVDFNEYKIAGESPLKMSLMPLLIFPDASSKFPLYFGVGAGLGVFFKQVKDESQVSFDYQLIAGARFFNIINQTGFFIETGMKNHLLITSDGQFNGAFLTGGAVFTF